MASLNWRNQFDWFLASFKTMLERLDDFELNKIADARADETIIKVKLDEL